MTCLMILPLFAVLAPCVWCAWRWRRGRFSCLAAGGLLIAPLLFLTGLPRNYDGSHCFVS